MERHTLEGSHGDVCRHPQNPFDFFCPAGCAHVREAPFCSSTTEAGLPRPDSPCRMPLRELTRVERLSNRLAELERARERFTAAGDFKAAAKAHDMIRLVKSDRQRARAEEEQGLGSEEAAESGSAASGSSAGAQGRPRLRSRSGRGSGAGLVY